MSRSLVRAAAVCLSLTAIAPARALPLVDVSAGWVEVQGWNPGTHTTTGSVKQAAPLDGLTLPTLQESSSGHPFDPPGTSGAAARLDFDRPGSGDAVYHSFAGGWAFSYTPEPYAKSGRTHLDLVGSLRILPPDMARLLGLLPLTASVRLETSLTLHGRFIAEAGAGGPTEAADAGVQVSRVLDGNNLGGELRLHAENGGAPVVTSSGLLAGDDLERSFGRVELESIFEGAMTAFGLSTARGASLLSADVITETIGFTAGGACQIQPNCFIPYYETPLIFSIATWGDAGFGQSTAAAADLRNTLNFSFTVLDANGRPTDIPVYLVLDGTTPGTVPEPGGAALLATALVLLAGSRMKAG